jgi:hypothetical protein
VNARSGTDAAGRLAPEAPTNLEVFSPRGHDEKRKEPIGLGKRTLVATVYLTALLLEVELVNAFTKLFWCCWRIKVAKNRDWRTLGIAQHGGSDLGALDKPTRTTESPAACGYSLVV